MSEDNFTIKEIEVQKLNLKSGDVLSVKVKSPQFDLDHLENLKKDIQSLFPNNKVMLFLADENNDVSFEIVSVESPVSTKACGPDPMSYCSDCNCGKKAAAAGV